MMDSKDPNTGKPLFKVLKVGLACDACQAAGIASECTHSKFLHVFCSSATTKSNSDTYFICLHIAVESFRPPWKSASKVSSVLLYCTKFFSSRLH